MADKESIKERMARLRAIKAAKKRQRDEQGDQDTPMSGSEAPEKRRATELTRPSNKMRLSDMMSLYLKQGQPVHNTDGSEAQGLPTPELYSVKPPTTRITPRKKPTVVKKTVGPTPMQIDEDASKSVASKSSSSVPSFVDKVKSAITGAASAYNSATPSLATSVGTAAVKFGIGLACAYALSKTAPSPTGGNPYSQSSFYM